MVSKLRSSRVKNKFYIWITYLVYQGLWCHLYSKNYFNNVQITILLTKQYKFFHRLRYLLRWFAGNTARSFLMFWNWFDLYIKTIKIYGTLLLNYFKIVMSPCYTSTRYIHISHRQRLSLTEKIIYSEFLR